MFNNINKKIAAMMSAIIVGSSVLSVNTNATSVESIDVNNNRVQYNYTDPDKANEEIANLLGKVYELEQENKRLTERVDELKELNEDIMSYWHQYTYKCSYMFDLNQDGTVDAMDASLVLTYYAMTSVGYECDDNYHEFIHDLYYSK